MAVRTPTSPHLSAEERWASATASAAGPSTASTPQVCCHSTAQSCRQTICQRKSGHLQERVLCARGLAHASSATCSVLADADAPGLRIPGGQERAPSHACRPGQAVTLADSRLGPAALRTTHSCSQPLTLPRAVYSRTLMHLACAYLEGKSVHPVTRADLDSGQVPDMPQISGTQANMSMDESEPTEAAEESTSGMQKVCCRLRSRWVAEAARASSSWQAALSRQPEQQWQERQGALLQRAVSRGRGDSAAHSAGAVQTC